LHSDYPFSPSSGSQFGIAKILHQAGNHVIWHVPE
jgi:hypothetical protein